MEIWKDITDFDNYEVSTFGNVRNKNTKRILKGRLDKDGYLRVGLYINSINSYNKQIHRLVATAFIDNPENKPIVDHIDNNKANNNILNLQWATNTENIVRCDYVKNAKNIYKCKGRDAYQIRYTSNGIIRQEYRTKFEDAEAVLAEWKRLYPHKII